MANEQVKVPLFAASEILTAANMNISAGTGVPVFATTVTRDAAFGGAGEKVLAEGQLCYLSATNIVQYYDGAAWATVGPSTVVATTSRIRLNTHNGYGTTSTVIPRYTTTVINTGADITYADSATLGSTFTINTAGMYAITVAHISPVSDILILGASLNSTELTTAINGITLTDQIAKGIYPLAVSDALPAAVSTTVYCAVNDVIRPHHSTKVPANNNQSFFNIVRVN